MGLQKVAFNFMVERGGKLAKSLLCTKPKDTIANAKNELFCTMFWKKHKQLNNSAKVTYHSHLHGINGYLNGTYYLGNVNFNNHYTYLPKSMSIKDLISVTDMEFKNLQPLLNEIIVFRGIRKPKIALTSIQEKLYNDLVKLKPGEKTVMREYAYTSSDKNFCNQYMGDKDGILLEILLPKGSRPSANGFEYVLPRYSTFECISNKYENNVHRIRLKYNLKSV